MIAATDIIAAVKKLWWPILVMALLASLLWAVNHYRNNAITFKKQRNEATEKLSLAAATIIDMQMRQRDVAALDAKYTGELALEKVENEKLRADVAAGKRRLQLKATCPESGASGSSSVDDVSGPRLTADAELNYWRLREGIVTVNKQLTGLQAYVREQCLR